MNNYIKSTTHLVIKFKKETGNAKECIDLVPITWTYYADENKLYCKYPEKNEYYKIDRMSKKSLKYKTTWRSFEIEIVKEAYSYEQGLRRMRRAFSDSVVHSSNLDEQLSSEEEADPIFLSKTDLKNSLMNVSSNLKNTDHEKTDSVSLQSEVSGTPIDNLQIYASSFSSSSPNLKNVPNMFQHSWEKNNGSSLSSSPTSPKTMNKFTGVKNQKKDDTEIQNKVILEKNYKYCPTCGSAAKDAPLSKSDLESMRRSIDYLIKEEAKITRALFTASSSYVDIEKILQEETMTDLPKIDLSRFLHVDNGLKNDIELFKKMKCFMVLNVKGNVRLSENLTTVIPKIISKAMQLQYSAFGRECNGIKKLNISETETYKLLLEVLNTKFPDTNNKEISSVVSRWFSGAKDRDGGKKERSVKKMKFNNEKDDVVCD